MPYLSRIGLNPLRKGSPQFLANPQRIHAAVQAAVPEQPVTGRTLWRSEVITDAYGKPCRVDLLVLTPTQPSWASLVESYGWPDTAGGRAEVRDYAPVLAAAQKGREFAFRVRANPSAISHSVGEPGKGGRGVRVGHRTAATQLNWFLERTGEDGALWGFTTYTLAGPTAVLTERSESRFWKGRPGQSNRVTLATATFEGHLRVTDPQRFRESLVQGLGRGKAYGCGLLTIARPRPGDVVAG